MRAIGSRLEVAPSVTALRYPLLLVGALAGASCDRAESAPNRDPEHEPPPRVRFDRPSIARYHMRQHFQDLKTIERRLVAGRLDDAKALAYFLSVREGDAGTAAWSAETARVTSAARELAKAKTLAEALHREVRIATACADCHIESQQLPRFPEIGKPPEDYSTPAARMSRHQWAVDRLWESLIANSDERWRAGLAVLAFTPTPPSAATDAPALEAALRERAKQAIDEHPTDLLDERAQKYGELLVTCAACHARIEKPDGDSCRSRANR